MNDAEKSIAFTFVQEVRIRDIIRDELKEILGIAIANAKNQRNGPVIDMRESDAPDGGHRESQQEYFGINRRKR